MSNHIQLVYFCGSPPVLQAKKQGMHGIPRAERIRRSHFELVSLLGICERGWGAGRSCDGRDSHARLPGRFSAGAASEKQPTIWSFTRPRRAPST